MLIHRPKRDVERLIKMGLSYEEATKIADIAEEFTKPDHGRFKEVYDQPENYPCI